MGTALIVDDEPAMSTLLSRLLAARGYATVAAGDGATARALALARLPDLILLDLMLPDESGIDVCRALKQDERTRHIPVVVVTARRLESCLEESLSAGAHRVVTKPFTPMQLFDALSSALNGHAEAGGER